jgi:hypothetical protein
MLASRSANARWKVSRWKVWIESLDGKFYDRKLGWKVWMESFLAVFTVFLKDKNYRTSRLV